jgi:hypothetical protein
MDARARFDEIVEDLEPRGVLPGALFGSHSLTLDGTAFACLKNEQFAVRLGAGTETYVDALALEGAGPFDPSGKGRPFKDWVALPVAQASQWGRMAETALVALEDG